MALPALWAGQEPHEIVKTLHEALIGMLRLDFVYARLDEATGGISFESLLVAGQNYPEAQAKEVGRALESWLTVDAPASRFTAPNPVGEGEVRIACFPLGLNKGNGLIAAASRRQDFPTETENLLLRVAVNQSAIALEAAHLATQRKLAEQRLSVQYEIARVLNESAALVDAVPRILETVCSSLDWQVGLLWSLDATAGVLRCVNVWHKPGANISEFEAVSRQRTFSAGVGLPGRVWSRAEPVWIPDVTSDDNFPRAPIAVREGLRAALGFPIIGGGEVVGVIEFFSHEIRQPDHDLLQMMATTGNQIGQFIERKRAEQMSLHLAAIVESSDDAIVSKTLEGVILSWNKGAERIFGYTAEEVIGKTIYIIIPPERHYEEPQILAKLRRGERIDHYETVRMTKDGRRVNISLTISPIKDKSGRIIAASKIARDITERIRMEQEREQLLAREQAARAEAERRWRESQLLASATRQFSASLQLQELLPTICRVAREIAEADGATFVRREGDYIFYAEEDACEPLWKGRRFPIAACISGWAILQHKPAVVEDIYSDHRLPIEAYQSTFVKSLVMVPIRAHDPLGAIGVYWTKQRKADDREVALLEALADAAQIALINTQLYEQTKAAREQAEEANRLKDEFLATVSHELRTPLNAMLGWTRMLRTGKLDEETNTRALETIERNAKSQAQLIEDLLDVSRIISGKMRLDVQPVDLAPVIQAAIDSVRPAADAKSIRLSVALDPRAGPVSGDPTRLQQIVWNLLSNAIKFTPKKGRVQVLLERVNSHIEITVSDTGIGISPEFLPHVFDRFRQADSTLTRSQSGLGLGLAIVRHLVELHGGNIQAESEGVGRGATFTIKLPQMIVRDAKRLLASASERKHPTAWPDVPFECPPALVGLRVLVVDDEPDARQLLKTILEQCKVEVTSVASAGEALDAIKRLKPDVLVSDIEMPGEDGYSLIRKVRNESHAQNGRIPAAALTAHAGIVDRMRALSAGFDIHIPKPVEPAELVAVIASLASRIGKGPGS